LALYLDALALRVRSAGKVVSVPALGVVAVLTDGQKQLLALELCPGGETFEAWKGCLDDLVTRGLAAPVWTVIDGHPGLRKAVALVWPRSVRKLGRVFTRSPLRVRSANERQPHSFPGAARDGLIATNSTSSNTWWRRTASARTR
jgi:transposase-like protein